MKKEQLLSKMDSLGPCFCGEYRGSKVERVEWIDKTDGKKKPFVTSTHLFEFGEAGLVQSVRIDQPVDREIMDPAQVKIPFTRGRRYLIQLTGLRFEKGSASARMSSRFTPIELSP